MELFPARPELSLQISPPDAIATASGNWRNGDEKKKKDLGFWRRALVSSNSTRHSDSNNDDDDDGTGAGTRVHSWAKAGDVVSEGFAAANASTGVFLQQQRFYHLPVPHDKFQRDLSSLLRPIRGIPVYQHPPSCSFPPLLRQGNLQRDGSSSHSANFSPIAPAQGLLRARYLPSSTRFFPAKRSSRAPRMRWTTTLHSRFVHAVELLGGHDRATPKSVLELMDVKDLTLAHVKSHLQMYRTVKNTEKSAVSSGQSDGVENGSSGEISDANLPDLRYDLNRSESNVSLWSNSSSRGVCSNDAASERPVEAWSIESIEENLQTSKPDLEFTLGRPQPCFFPTSQ